MLASELIDEVQRIGGNVIVATDYDDATILAFLNRGRISIAGGGDRQHGTAKLPPLPDLLTSATVTVAAAGSSSSMPATYQRDLLRVTNSAGERLTKFDSLTKMLDRYQGSTGGPEAYCLKGRVLWVAPIPTASTALTVLFHQYPVAMVIEEYPPPEPPEEPAGPYYPTELPEHLQHGLLVNFTLREIFREIELGVSEHNNDSEKHDLRFQLAITDLERFIGPAEGEAQNISDEYSSEDNI